MNFCILGAGAWGTAMAVHLDRAEQTVTLVPRRMELSLALASTRENADYLPGRKLADSIQIAHELKPALMEVEVILLACPVAGLRSACERIVEVLESSWRLKLLLVLCKGLDRESLSRPTELVRKLVPGYCYGVLSGPSNADEVALAKPTAMSLAADADETLLIAVQEALSSESLRVYRSNDVIGVELGAALKNVYAIGAGIADGLALGDNAKAAFLTRAIQEMVTVGSGLGGQSATFFGLSGFGDLTATCFGSWSRNRSFGEAVAKGEKPGNWVKSRDSVVEGYWAVETFHELCGRERVVAPILEEIYAVLFHEKSPQSAMMALMQRPLKEEKM